MSPPHAFLHFCLSNRLLVKVMSGSNLLLAWNMEQPIAAEGDQPGEVWAVQARGKKRILRSAAGGKVKLRPGKDEGVVWRGIRWDPSPLPNTVLLPLTPGNNFRDRWNMPLQGWERGCEQENLTCKKSSPKKRCQERLSWVIWHVYQFYQVKMGQEIRRAHFFNSSGF